MQFLGTIQKLASLFPRLQNAKWRKNPIISAVTEAKYVRIPMFLRNPRAREHGETCIYAYTGLSVEYALGKGYYISKIPPVQTKNQIITVSVFLCTLQSTALLSKKFRLLLHCYTLTHVG